MLFLLCSHQAFSFLFLLIWKANIAEEDENVKSWESAAQLMRLLWHLLKNDIFNEGEKHYANFFRLLKICWISVISFRAYKNILTAIRQLWGPRYEPTTVGNFFSLSRTSGLTGSYLKLWYYFPITTDDLCQWALLKSSAVSQCSSTELAIGTGDSCIVNV